MILYSITFIHYVMNLYNSFDRIIASYYFLWLSSKPGIQQLQILVYTEDNLFNPFDASCMLGTTTTTKVLVAQWREGQQQTLYIGLCCVQVSGVTPRSVPILSFPLQQSSSKSVFSFRASASLQASNVAQLWEQSPAALLGHALSCWRNIHLFACSTQEKM